MIPLHQRTIIIASAAAVVLRANEPTRTNIVAAAVDSTNFDLDAGASAVADTYNGLAIRLLYGVGAGYLGYVTDHGNGAVRRVTVTPALTTQPNTATTFELGPGLPPAFGQLTIGGAANIVYYSFRAGGTAGTDRMELATGIMRTFDLYTAQGIRVLEILASVAADTIRVEWT